MFVCAGDAQSERLDASYEWLPAPPGRSQPMAGFGDGCSDPLPYDLAGKVQHHTAHHCTGRLLQCGACIRDNATSPCLQTSACLAFVVSIYTCKQLWHEFTYQWGINRWHWWCLGSRVAACTSAHMPTSSGVVQLFAVNTVLSGAQQRSTYSIPEGSKYKRQSDCWGGVQRCPGCQCVGGGCLGGAGGRRGAVRLRRAGVRAAAEDLGHQRATCLCPGALAGAYLPTQVTRHRAGGLAEGR